MAFVAALVRSPLKHGLSASQLSEIVLRSGISAAVFAEIGSHEWEQRQAKGEALAYANTSDLTRLLISGSNTYPSEIPMKAVDRLINAFSSLEGAHGVKTPKPLDRLCAEMGGTQREAHVAIAFLLAIGHVVRIEAGFVRRMTMAPGVYGSSRSDHPSQGELKRFISILDDVLAEEALVREGTEEGEIGLTSSNAVPGEMALDGRGLARQARVVFEKMFASRYRSGQSTPIAPQSRNAKAELTLEYLARRGVIVTAGPGSLYRISDRGKDLSFNMTNLDQALGLDTNADAEHTRHMVQGDPDPRSIFVIHGRNLRARDEMGIFLRACGLKPINFGDLRAELGGTPTIDRIVEEGMRRAQGVIALFTADEYSALRLELRGEGEEGEALSRWQARPNVIFEAGMAFGKARDRVVFVVLGEVKLFSDVAGVHVLRPTNSPKGDRSVLRDTLRKSMRCEVEDSNAWMDHGDFDSYTHDISRNAPRDPFASSPSDATAAVVSNKDARIRLRAWIDRLHESRSRDAIDFSEIAREARIGVEQAVALLAPVLEDLECGWSVVEAGEAVVILNWVPTF